MFANRVRGSRFAAVGAERGLHAFVAVVSLTLTSFHFRNFPFGHCHGSISLIKLHDFAVCKTSQYTRFCRFFKCSFKKITRIVREKRH